MNNDHFKIIKPAEAPPKELEKEVMGSVKTVILILRIVQLFVGDIEGAVLNMFKTKPKKILTKKDSDERN